MDSESPQDSIDATESLEAAEPIEVAEVVEEIEVAEVVEVTEGASYAESGPEVEKLDPLVHDQLPPQFQNVAAKGGAVAALVLGCLAVFGAFVTQWSLFNAVVGLVLGLWGLGSNLSRTAVVGMILCGIGLVLCGVVPAVWK